MPRTHFSHAQDTTVFFCYIKIFKERFICSVLFCSVLFCSVLFCSRLCFPTLLCQVFCFYGVDSSKVFRLLQYRECGWFRKQIIFSPCTQTLNSGTESVIARFCFFSFLGFEIKRLCYLSLFCLIAYRILTIT